MVQLKHVRSVIDTATTILVAVAAAVALWRFTHQPPRAVPPDAVESVQGLSIDLAKVSHTEGTGELVLVEFADYECPFCARHARETGPRIKQRLIDTGRLRHVFFNFPLPMHPNAQKAGEAAECANKQGKFWEMHHRLFAQTGALTVPDLLDHAKTIGLKADEFAKCLDSGETAQVVSADVTEGRRLGVIATPAFFLGRVTNTGSITLIKKVNGAVPFEQFDKAIEGLAQPRRASR